MVEGREVGIGASKQPEPATDRWCLAKGCPNKVLMEIFPRGVSKGTPPPLAPGSMLRTQLSLLHCNFIIKAHTHLSQVR